MLELLRTYYELVEFCWDELTRGCMPNKGGNRIWHVELAKFASTYGIHANQLAAIELAIDVDLM